MRGLGVVSSSSLNLNLLLFGRMTFASFWYVDWRLDSVGFLMFLSSLIFPMAKLIVFCLSDGCNDDFRGVRNGVGGRLDCVVPLPVGMSLGSPSSVYSGPNGRHGVALADLMVMFPRVSLSWSAWL